MDYLEYNGSPRITKDVSLLDLLKERYNWVCMVSDICKLPSQTVRGLDSSPSVDIRRQDYERLLLLLNIKGGTSLKNLVHMGQLYNSKTFQKYDYGSERNFWMYGSELPPRINISKITIPVALVVAKNDQIADARDNKDVM
jgi:hypothetical protein